MGVKEGKVRERNNGRTGGKARAIGTRKSRSGGAVVLVVVVSELDSTEEGRGKGMGF